MLFAEAVLVLRGRPCDGCELVGFSVWRNSRGTGVTVTFPGRAYTNAKGERRTFSFVQGGANNLAGLRALIAEAFAAATPPTEG